MSLENALKRCIKKKDISDRQKYPADVAAHLKTGIDGENEAAEFLRGKGYSVIDRNVHYRFGEIDIIARDADTIVFAEVRTRNLGYLMPADTTVGPDKMRKLVMSARSWVEEHNFDGFWRLDLIAITIDKYGNKTIEHIRDITEGIS